MKVNFIYRNGKIGYSIEKVFKIVENVLEKHVNIQRFVLPKKGSMPCDIIKNNLYYLKAQKKNTAQIHHVTGHVHDIFLSLIGTRSVLTIHDLVFLDNVKNPIKKIYKWLFWFYLPIKLTDRIVCISEHTKQNVLSRMKANNLVVIHNPIDPDYRFVPRIFNEQNPVIIHIGTGWNKNLKRTIYALENIPCHLRIIGKITTDLEYLLKEKEIDYSNKYDLSDKEIRKEYIMADIVSFPSEYEGFGMPIIEAQKTGRCVLTSNIAPMTEVAGDAAMFVDPFDINSIRGGFENLIQNERLRAVLIKKGLKNCERFDSKDIALKYLNLYKEILSDKL